MALSNGRLSPSDEIVLTHLDDLQSEFEAGSRQLNVIADSVEEIREAVTTRHLQQAALTGRLVHQVEELLSSVREQRERLRELRRVLRDRLR